MVLIPNNKTLVKIIIPVALGCASLSWYNAHYKQVDKRISSVYENVTTATHNRTYGSNLPNLVKIIEHLISGIYDKSKSVHENNRYIPSENANDLIEYAGKLHVNSNAMPLDEVVSTLNKEYSTMWPERPIDEKYFLAIMSVESGFNPKAYNKNGGATGLAGFLRSSWHANSDKPFKSATDPEENIKSLMRLTKTNLQLLEDNYPDWYNTSQLEQDVQLGLAHSAGFARMQAAGFDPHNIKKRWIRNQSIDYEAKMRDYLTR